MLSSKSSSFSRKKSIIFLLDAIIFLLDAIPLLFISICGMLPSKVLLAFDAIFVSTLRMLPSKVLGAGVDLISDTDAIFCFYPILNRNAHPFAFLTVGIGVLCRISP